MLWYAFTIFLSAFLLFQVQPVIARMILPWFGGSAAVWTTCMLFFQVTLLLGYLYVYWAVRRLNPSTHSRLHIGLLVASLLLLPITPGANWKPAPEANPSFAILLLLAACVGLQYFLLSTTSPLLQTWYTRTGHGVMPYRLFALSNLGSMLALISYPVLVEPRMPAKIQGTVWSLAYAAFVALCAVSALKSTRGSVVLEASTDVEPDAPKPPDLSTLLLWGALAAVPSALLLSVTNHMTQDVASIPFLWIVPLVLYLLSFILCFDAPAWYERAVFLPLLPLALIAMAYGLDIGTEDTNIRILILGFSVAFFICCMVCHGEMVRIKPDPRYLTSFYLMLSVGGAAGGIFVGLIAPYFFISNFEFPISIVLCSVLVVLVLTQDPKSPFFEKWTHPAIAALMAVAVGLTFFVARTAGRNIRDYKLIQRNFYGILRVRETKTPADWEGYRTLLHGAINHGEEWTHPDRRRDPLTYYCPESGVGLAIRTRKPLFPQKVGVFGLGSGSIAGFGRENDVYRFYEINPLVPKIASGQFFYVPESRAKVDISLGDARLSLERQPQQNFDVLAVDCFSGDSIPVHLLTKEAVELYFRHLKPDGILALHVSNRFLDLPPVIERVATSLGKATYQVETEDDDERSCFGTTWVLMARNKEVFEVEPIQGKGQPVEAKQSLPAWTDDYSSLFGILK